MNFTDGWPGIKYPDQPGYDNWNISYYLNSADIKIANLNEQGISSLRLGETGFTSIEWSSSDEKAAGAETPATACDYLDRGQKTHSRFDFRFGILQNRQLPDDGWLKEWKLVHKDGKFWLCLIAQVRQPKADCNQATAGVDIGWRRTETGIKIATVYDPTRKQSKEIHLDLDSRPYRYKGARPVCDSHGAEPRLAPSPDSKHA